MKYRLKRLLSGFVANAQAIRWHTQEWTIRRFWKPHLHAHLTVLDLGCGGGTYAIEFPLKAGCRTILAEMETAHLELARKQVAEEGLSSKASFTQLEDEDLPFTDQFFDRIQCFEVLEHVPEAAKTLRELHRISKPGGLLMLSVPHPPEWVPNPLHVVEGFTYAEMDALSKSNGWEVLRYDYSMLIGTRIVFYALNGLGRSFPFPVFLLAMEELLPSTLRKRLLPYNLIALLKRVG